MGEGFTLPVILTLILICFRPQNQPEESVLKLRFWLLCLPFATKRRRIW